MVVTTVTPVNTLPVIAAFAGLILLIFIAAALSKIKLIGVVGALLLILLGVWLFTGGIYLETGKNIISRNDVISIPLNETNSSNATLSGAVSHAPAEFKGYNVYIAGASII